MSDTKSGDKKTISINSTKTLMFKRTGLEQGAVRQSFLHGRNKSVTVETKRKFLKFPSQQDASQVDLKSPSPVPESQNTTKESSEMKVKALDVQETASLTKGDSTKNLSVNELEARRRALEDSITREKEDQKQRLLDQKKREERENHQNREKEEELQRFQLEEAARLKKEAESRSRLEEEARHRIIQKETRGNEEEEESGLRKRIHVGGEKSSLKNNAAEFLKTKNSTRNKNDYGRHKMTLSSVLSFEEGNVRSPSLSATRRRNEKFKRSLNQAPREKIIREVLLPETITIQDLAGRMSERAVEVVKFFMRQGQMMKPGDVIDADTAELVASEFGHTVKRIAESDIEGGLFNVQDDPKDTQPRPPVVSVMGHVDHGKTSLLDAIRKANVASKEHGSITQHIGAYQIERNNQKITFIDTPGHAAFSAMRARGAEATDIVVLVVAADDSVMRQTVESINHAKAAHVPIIVAINKMDKPEADPKKVCSQLMQHDIFVESMGGETLAVEISAKKGTNLDKLLDAIFLQAEILDLRANPDRTAEGVVIESKLDGGRGPIATVLVQTGTLMPGDIIVAGNEWGRVRALVNDHGINIKEATPSTPVVMLGLQAIPQAGDRFSTVENEARAREITQYRQRLAQDKAVAKHIVQRGSLQKMMTQMQTGSLKELSLIIKGDVQGSLGAIVSALEDLGTDEVRARIIYSAAGGITESDVSLAITSNALIIGFNVRPNAQARMIAEKEKVTIKQYTIIYALIEDVKAQMSDLLEPERREKFLGKAEVLEVFNITKIGNIAGCLLVEGKIERGANIRLMRDNMVVHDGMLATLRRFKDEVSEVNAGQECGIGFKNYQDIRVGDKIEAYRVEMIKRTL